MADNLLDNALFLQIRQRLPRQRTVNLQTIDEDSNGDETVSLNVLVESVLNGLVGDDGVLGLILDYNIDSTSDSLPGLALVQKSERESVCEKFTLSL